jgi:hypothetical protein
MELLSLRVHERQPNYYYYYYYYYYVNINVNQYLHRAVSVMRVLLLTRHIHNKELN